MQSILNIIVSLGNFIEQKFQTKAGTFALGFLIAGAALGGVGYLYYLQVEEYKKVILENQHRIEKLERDKEVLAKRLENTDSTCIRFFNSVYGMVDRIGYTFDKAAANSSKLREAQNKNIAVYQDRLINLDSISNER